MSTRPVALLLLLIGLAGCTGNPDAPPAVKVVVGPSAEKEGLTWSHRELVAHLEKQGLECTALPMPGANELPTVVLFNRKNVTQPEPGDDSVFIYLHPTAQAAKDRAGTLGELGFCWGRFVFQDPVRDNSGPPGSFLATVRKALP